MLQGKKKSKGDQIIEMLEQGFDPKYISKKLKTTKQNIYKEKSLKKRDINKDVTTPVTSFTDDKIRSRKTHSKVISQPKQVEDDNSQNQINMPSIKPTRKENIQMYSGFLEGKGPEQIIAAHGIDSEIAESEYERFLKLKGMDPRSLQLSIVNISDTDSEQAVILIRKIKSGNLLSNDEVMSLIDSEIRSRESKYLHELLRDLNMLPPPPVIRPTCFHCGNHFSGILIKVPDDDGRLALAYLKKCICSRCLNFNTSQNL